MSAYMKNYISSIFPGVNVNTILQGLSLIILIVGLLSILLNVFVFNPLQVGCQHWFIRSRTEDNYNIGSVSGWMNSEGHKANILSTVSTRASVSCYVEKETFSNGSRINNHYWVINFTH